MPGCPPCPSNQFQRSRAYFQRAAIGVKRSVLTRRKAPPVCARRRRSMPYKPGGWGLREWYGREDAGGLRCAMAGCYTDPMRPLELANHMRAKHGVQVDTAEIAQAQEQIRAKTKRAEHA